VGQRDDLDPERSAVAGVKDPAEEALDVEASFARISKNYPPEVMNTWTISPDQPSNSVKS